MTFGKDGQLTSLAQATLQETRRLVGYLLPRFISAIVWRSRTSIGQLQIIKWSIDFE